MTRLHGSATPKDWRYLKYSCVIRGHKTSVSIEPPFLEVLKEMAVERDIALNTLITELEESGDPNLSRTLRLAALAWCRTRMVRPA